MQIYFHSCLCSYLPRVPILVEDTVCMYVCMHVCTKSFLKTTTNSSCVCTHLANKADSDSESDIYISFMCMETLFYLRKKKICNFSSLLYYITQCHFISCNATSFLTTVTLYLQMWFYFLFKTLSHNTFYACMYVFIFLLQGLMVFQNVLQLSFVQKSGARCKNKIHMWSTGRGAIVGDNKERDRNNL